MEEWRAIPGWEDLYEVSDMGRFKSLRRIVQRNGRPAVLKERIRTPRVCGKRYARVALLCGDEMQVHQFHRAVLLTFVGPLPDGLWGLHHDGDITNNTLGNLYYGTPTDNAADRIAHGRSGKGMAHGRAKLTDDDVRMIRASSASGRELAQQLGVSYGLIGHVRNRRCWKHLDA